MFTSARVAFLTHSHANAVYAERPRRTYAATVFIGGMFAGARVAMTFCRRTCGAIIYVGGVFAVARRALTAFTDADVMFAE
jgi:hypothetical protein